MANRVRRSKPNGSWCAFFLAAAVGACASPEGDGETGSTRSPRTEDLSSPVAPELDLVCPSCGPQEGGETSDFGPGISPTSPNAPPTSGEVPVIPTCERGLKRTKIDATASPEVKQAVERLRARVERSFQSPLLWKAEDPIQGGAAPKGYSEEATQIEGKIKTTDAWLISVNPEVCTAGVCNVGESIECPGIDDYWRVEVGANVALHTLDGAIEATLVGAADEDSMVASAALSEVTGKLRVAPDSPAPGTLSAQLALVGESVRGSLQVDASSFDPKGYIRYVPLTAAFPPADGCPSSQLPATEDWAVSLLDGTDFTADATAALNETKTATWHNPATTELSVQLSDTKVECVGESALSGSATVMLGTPGGQVEMTAVHLGFTYVDGELTGLHLAADPSPLPNWAELFPEMAEKVSLTEPEDVRISFELTSAEGGQFPDWTLDLRLYMSCPDEGGACITDSGPKDFDLLACLSTDATRTAACEAFNPRLSSSTTGQIAFESLPPGPTSTNDTPVPTSTNEAPLPTATMTPTEADAGTQMQGACGGSSNLGDASACN